MHSRALWGSRCEVILIILANVCFIRTLSTETTTPYIPTTSTLTTSADQNNDPSGNIVGSVDCNSCTDECRKKEWQLTGNKDKKFKNTEIFLEKLELKTGERLEIGVGVLNTNESGSPPLILYDSIHKPLKIWIESNTSYVYLYSSQRNCSNNLRFNWTVNADTTNTTSTPEPETSLEKEALSFCVFNKTFDDNQTELLKESIAYRLNDYYSEKSVLFVNGLIRTKDVLLNTIVGENAFQVAIKSRVKEMGVALTKTEIKDAFYSNNAGHTILQSTEENSTSFEIGPCEGIKMDASWYYVAGGVLCGFTLLFIGISCWTYRNSQPKQIKAEKEPEMLTDIIPPRTMINPAFQHDESDVPESPNPDGGDPTRNCSNSTDQEIHDISNTRNVFFSNHALIRNLPIRQSGRLQRSFRRNSSIRSDQDSLQLEEDWQRLESQWDARGDDSSERSERTLSIEGLPTNPEEHV